MNLKIATKILNKYVKCPMCGHDKLGNGHGALIIEDEVLERSCRCGFIIRINKDEEVILHRYESNENTYCGKCNSKVEGGYCEWVAEEIKGE